MEILYKNSKSVVTSVGQGDIRDIVVSRKDALVISEPRSGFVTYDNILLACKGCHDTVCSGTAFT